MSFEEFKEKVAKEFLDYMPEEYSNNQVAIVETVKVNQVLHGLILKGEDRNISPNIYLEDMYEDYQYCGFEDAMKRAAELMINGIEAISGFTITMPTAETFDKQSVVFRLINAEKNEALLSNTPHRLFEDLAIVYYQRVEFPNGDIGLYVITNAMCEICKLTEEQLYNLAFENTRGLNELRIIDMNDIIKETLISDGIPEGMVEMMMEEMSNEPFKMYVVTNEEKTYGAVSMLYSDILDEVADKYDGSFFILPSSVHDIICLPICDMSPEYMKEMVCEVNDESLAEEEFLSDNIYFYNRDTKKVSLYKA